MFCGISGEPPETPVVSKKSGQIYEKRLIVKYIEEHGKDPLNGDVLALDDILDVKTEPQTVRPRPPTVTSIPSLLSVLQNEWDAVMLETFTLKQQYQQVRQELSQALYQHDAACRVIARLMKERDAAREALANIQAHLGTGATTDGAVTNGEAVGDVEMAAKETLPANVVEQVQQTHAALSAVRRKRKPPVEFTDISKVEAFTKISEATSLHGARPAGITSLDLDSERDLVLTGGNDKNVQVYNRIDDKVVVTLKGHKKAVSQVKWRRGEIAKDAMGDTIVSASEDKTVKIWVAGESGYAAEHTLSEHTADVTGIDVHPSKRYIVSAGMDSTWMLYDIETGSVLAKVTDSETTAGYTAVQFHPDGAILATGTADGLIRMWDVATMRTIATFSDHTGKITALSFAENGYQLAAGCEDNIVRIWDLRKSIVSKSITLDAGYQVRSLNYDYWAQYLAVGGTDVRIYKAKDLAPIATFRDASKEVTGLAWGPNATYLVTCGTDRSIRVYGTA